MALPERNARVLAALVARAGAIVPKDDLVSAAWDDVAVSDNSLEQAVSSLRKALGPGADGLPYIETVPRQGYRFAGEVRRSVSRTTDEGLAALLAPHRAFIEGRAQLETLDRDAVGRAAAVFADIVAAAPHHAPAHIGLANALALRFESTRTADEPDVAALQTAAGHAREACRLDAGSSEAWATLALVLSRAGAGDEAVSAARRAVAIDPDNWRHQLRLAVASWGDERLRTAHRAQRLLPGLALAHWLAATVHIARQSFDTARHELVAGAEAQDAQRDGERFGAVGLHLLTGLVDFAHGDRGSAIEQFQREIAATESGHVYAREARANSWAAIGAIKIHTGDHAEAVEALERAVQIVPGHLAARGALSVLLRRPDDLVGRRLTQLRAAGTNTAAVDAAAIEAIQAATGLASVLSAAPAGSSGWIIPVDPFLATAFQPAAWAAVLRLLRARAA
jgi:DNA-binding winged helix-turn-helix (wHTH) protein/cytochrome c-type biogenesis protein CcmH/NrfG